jgi:LEA14-like dessication related protein
MNRSPRHRPSVPLSLRPSPLGPIGRGRLASGVVRSLGLAILLFALSGCALFFRSPDVRIVDVRVVGLGFTSGTAEVILQVDNPNRFGLEVRGLDYLLEVGPRADAERWDTLAVGFNPDTIQLPRRSEREVAIRIPFRYQALGTALGAWMQGGDIPYRVQGELKARGPGGERDLPFRSSGTIRP